MRTFGFGKSLPDQQDPSEEWALHIQCPWRLESETGIVTGKSDWYEPVDESWDSEAGRLDTSDRLQDARLKSIFSSSAEPNGPLRNTSDQFAVEAVEIGDYGDFSIALSGGFRLHAFPDGSRGEYWRVFKRGDFGSHHVCGPGS